MFAMKQSAEFYSTRFLTLSLLLSLLTALTTSCVKEPDKPVERNELKTERKKKLTREKKPSRIEDFNFLKAVVPLKDPDKYVTPPGNEKEKRSLAVCKEVKSLAVKGEWKKALSMVREAAVLTPDYPPLWNAKGVIYNEEKLFDNALKAYERAVLLDPRYYTAWSNLGLLYARRSNFAQSEKVFDYLTKLAPGEPKIWKMAARIKIERQKGKEAEKYLLKALELAPEDADIWYRLAYDYHCMKDYDRAESAYKKSLRLNPKHFFALKFLGVLYQDRKKYSKAREVFKELTAKYPNKAVSWSCFGYLCRAEGKYDEALKYYEKSARVDPANSSGLVDAAVLYRDKGEFDKAETLLKEARTRQPSWYFPVYQLGRLELVRFNLKKSINYLNVALSMNPSRASIYNSLGCALSYSEKTDEALKAFADAVKYDPGYALAWGNLAESNREMGNLKEAKRCAMKAARLNPESPFLLATLASLFLIDDKPDPARKLLKKALSIDPHYAFAWHNLGLIAIADKDLKTAIESFEKAVKYDPDDATSWSNLAELYKKSGKKDLRARALRKAASARKGNRPEDLYRIAHSLEQMGLKRDASRVRKDGLDLDPDEADVLINVPYYMDQAKSAPDQSKKNAK